MKETDKETRKAKHADSQMSNLASVWVTLWYLPWIAAIPDDASASRPVVRIAAIQDGDDIARLRFARCKRRSERPVRGTPPRSLTSRKRAV